MSLSPERQAKRLKMEAKSETASPAAAALTAEQLNRFSRQNAALGSETTAKLIQMKVLIVGCRGVGIEVAKNLALQGAGSITLLDNAETTVQDTGVNFFLIKEDVVARVKRAQACAPRLQELNPICNVRVATALTDELMLGHSVVVITQPTPLTDLMRMDFFCAANGISFMYNYISGVSSSLFVNLGPNHIVTDPNGEKPMQKLIVDISPISDEECLIRYDTPEGSVPVAVTEGDYEVTEVEGLDGINGALFKVHHPWKDPVKTVRIPLDSRGLPPYVQGGILREKKLPAKHPMLPFASKVRDPECLVSTDLLGFSESQQHIAFVAIHTFFSEKGRLPGLYNSEDAADCLSIANRILNDGTLSGSNFMEGTVVDETLLTYTANLASVELQPIAAFIGGVLAQEVVKCTGKYTPIPGFMHFRAAETLPDAKPVNFSPRVHRNDELAAVFGWETVEKLSNLNYFMVGSGAIGCEHMKNFALNGIFCGPRGKLTVTDPDRIELSNLSRQFLFREHNVGQPKSRAAAAMATIMHPDFKIDSVEHFVGPKSENIFNDAFWTGLDGVCNALDNMEARLYVDNMCVKYEKSLLESGTMSTSGNVDTIYPFKTRTYADGGAAAEGGGVPMCTLRNFPHLTDHCIEWARDQFELLFVKLGKSAQTYSTTPAVFEANVRELAKSEKGVAFFETRALTSLLKACRGATIGAAATLAFNMFHFLFRDRVLDLQAAFPRDARVIDKDTKKDLGPFWSEKKRYPDPVVFNPHDEGHVNFMLSTTCLFGVLMGLIPPKKEGDEQWLHEYRHRDWIIDLTAGLTPPPYIRAPVSGAGITDGAMDEEMDTIMDTLIADLRGAASELALPAFEAADFEKDDDLNFHIAFIASAANLRCDNYHIKRTDFQECKIIAGKILAAIATTTAAVCGLVLLEFIKVNMGTDVDINRLMNRQIGLGINSFVSFTQEPPKKFATVTNRIVPEAKDLPEDAFDATGKIKEEFVTKEVDMSYPEAHSVWDKIVVQGAMSLGEFNVFLEQQHGLKMGRWDFVFGRKKKTDEEGRKYMANVTKQVFPVIPPLNYALIPALDLTKQGAMRELMKAGANPMQRYLALWEECKAQGAVPAGPPDAGQAISSTTTLAEILRRMAANATAGLASGEIDEAVVANIDGRSFWLIHGAETPKCNHAESRADVNHLAAFKIVL